MCEEQWLKRKKQRIDSKKEAIKINSDSDSFTHNIAIYLEKGQFDKR